MSGWSKSVISSNDIYHLEHVFCFSCQNEDRLVSECLNFHCPFPDSVKSDSDQWSPMLTISFNKASRRNRATNSAAFVLVDPGCPALLSLTHVCHLSVQVWPGATGPHRGALWRTIRPSGLGSATRFSAASQLSLGLPPPRPCFFGLVQNNITSFPFAWD